MKAKAPIKDTETINAIKNLYQKKNKIRDLLMFTLAVNTGADFIDLLNLKISDVKNKDYLILDHKKSIPLNDELKELIKKVTKGHKLSEPLFQNQCGKKLTRSAVFYSFREICKELGISKNISVASWRKTFAYHYYMKYKDLSFIQWLFDQQNIDLTLKFIDVTENMNLRFREGVCL